jgi:ABC-2 type transport system ATP-binding protein
MAPRAGRAEHLAQAPTMIEVHEVSKTFLIPYNRVDSLRERFTHPLSRHPHRRLEALRRISFEVRKGEFFGIVGRNGSGKSTLLKIMASIYGADEGRVRMGGRLAPFIELGVGFNPELTSRQNVLLNGVLMGLSRREAERRLDAVLDFAELRDFADLKLKNYSSGMMVRLAFAIMVQADADIMLIDEVLAVGDAAFSQKCMNVFREHRDTGRTIVLVTHDMTTVQGFCDRAMLIDDAEMRYIGEPDETALRYFRLNFGGDPDRTSERGTLPDVQLKVLDVWIEDENGIRVENVEQHRPFRFNCVTEARRELRSPMFSFHFLDDEGARIFGFNKTLELPQGAPDRLLAGERVRISGEIENRLLPGRYHVECWATRNRTAGDLAVHPMRLLDFIVYGTEPAPGSVEVRNEVRAVIESESAQ